MNDSVTRAEASTSGVPAGIAHAGCGQAGTRLEERSDSAGSRGDRAGVESTHDGQKQNGEARHRSPLYKEYQFISLARNRPAICDNESMAHQFTASYIEDARTVFAQYKQMAERAMEQVNEEQLRQALDAEGNSIATIVKHLAGNMRSRWTDFLTSDGEKPNRNRDSEFEEAPATREEVMRIWEDGWTCVFSALESLSDADLARTVTIRRQEHSAMQAITRQIAHYAQHVGQIILLAKHFAGGRWQTLSIPRRAVRSA